MFLCTRHFVYVPYLLIKLCDIVGPCLSKQPFIWVPCIRYCSPSLFTKAWVQNVCFCLLIFLSDWYLIMSLLYLKTLYWIPFTYRIKSKLFNMVHKALYMLALTHFFSLTTLTFFCIIFQPIRCAMLSLTSLLPNMFLLPSLYFIFFPLF